MGTRSVLKETQGKLLRSFSAASARVNKEGWRAPRRRRLLTDGGPSPPMRPISFAIPVDEMPRRSGAFHNCGNGMRIQAAQFSSVKDADRQPLVTTGCGGGYLPIGYLPTGYLPTGAGAGGGGSLRGRSAAAAALSIAKDAAAAIRIFSMT
jgi:hypothetical protein